MQVIPAETPLQIGIFNIEGPESLEVYLKGGGSFSDLSSWLNEAQASSLLEAMVAHQLASPIGGGEFQCVSSRFNIFKLDWPVSDGDMVVVFVEYRLPSWDANTHG
jgi:hypothetical protein